MVGIVFGDVGSDYVVFFVLVFSVGEVERDFVGLFSRCRFCCYVSSVRREGKLVLEVRGVSFGKGGYRSRF